MPEGVAGGLGIMETTKAGMKLTCDHHKRSLIMCQSEFSIQRRSIGKRNKQAASKFGSKYKATASRYRGGMPLCLGRNGSIPLTSTGE